MASNVTRDHHTFTRDTVKNVSGNLTLDIDGDLTLDADGGDVNISQADLNISIDKKVRFGNTGEYIVGDNTDLDIVSSNDATIDVGGDINLDAGGGDVNILQADLNIPATQKLTFDGGDSNTYITESASNPDTMRIVVGDALMVQLTENGGSNNNVLFRTASVGFSRIEATFSDTTVIISGGSHDTDIDFRVSNKYRLEMIDDIETMNLIFPNSSGNFLLVCAISSLNGGNHDVSNWKVYESDLSPATTTDVMWAGGGTRPAFTAGTATDIVSFYWDSVEQQAYGVASLEFATP